jgi:hypothetical protein
VITDPRQDTRFQQHWQREVRSGNPSLARALRLSFGGYFLRSQLIK